MSPTEIGVARAAALFERVDPVKAAALLESVLAADPASAAGWILMSRIRLVLDEVDRALDAAGRAIALVPDDPRPLAVASRALTLLGRHEEAITTAYRAVIAEPENPLWHDRVAWSLIAADRQLRRRRAGGPYRDRAQPERGALLLHARRDAGRARPRRPGTAGVAHLAAPGAGEPGRPAPAGRAERRVRPAAGEEAAGLADVRAALDRRWQAGPPRRVPPLAILPRSRSS